MTNKSKNQKKKQQKKAQAARANGTESPVANGYVFFDSNSSFSVLGLGVCAGFGGRMWLCSRGRMRKHRTLCSSARFRKCLMGKAEKGYVFQGCVQTEGMKYGLALQAAAWSWVI